MRVHLTKTDLLVLCVVVIWAATFSVIKYGMREIDPLPFAAVRFLVSAALLLIWVWAAEGRPVIRREDWLWVTLVGLTGIGVYQIFFMVGLNLTTASNSSLLLATAPVWTAIVAFASRQERVSPLQVVGILLSFAGVGFIIKAGGGELAVSWQNFRGDILTVIAAILTAAAAVISRRPLRRYSSLRVMSISVLCGSLFLLPFAWPQLVATEWAHVSLSAWLALAYSSILGAVIAYVIWFKSIGEIGATRTVVYNTLIPPIAVFIAMLTLGERFTPLQALGGVVVLVGVGLTRFGKAKSPAWKEGQGVIGPGRGQV